MAKANAAESILSAKKTQNQETKAQKAKTKAKLASCKDAHRSLCATIKKQKHCAMPRYKKYCPASCGSCGKKAAKKATKKATKKAKKGKKKAKKKKSKKKKGKSLKDSQHSSIEDLERQLSSSISKASVAIKHAHSTVTSA